MLANTFSFDGDRLEISIGSVNTVVVTQSETDFHFNIANGNWSGTDQNGATGSSTQQLTVTRESLDEVQLDGTLAQDIDLLFQGDTDLSQVDFVGEYLDWSGQSADSVLTTSNLVLKSETIQLTNANNRFQGTVGFESPRVTVHNSGDLNISGSMDIGFGVFQSEGDWTFDGSQLVAISLQVDAGGDLTIQTSDQFKINQMSVQGQNIEVHAISSGFKDEYPIVTRLQRLNFESEGNVLIETRDESTELSSTYLRGSNTANHLVLDFQGSIFGNHGSDLRVVNDARIKAVGRIWFGHFNGDTIEIGGQADLEASNGTHTRGNLFIGSASEVNFGSLRLSGTGNFVNISEDSTTIIDEIDFENIREVVIASKAAIYDSAGAVIRNVSHLGLFADDILVLGENSLDQMTVGKAVFFGSHIFVGGKGTATFQSLYFESDGQVRIFEDDSTYLIGHVQANSLVLNTPGSISNRPGFSLTTQHGASFRAGERVFLANNSNDQLNIHGKAEFYSRIATIVGRGGRASFAQLTFHTSYLDIRETGRMHLVGDNSASRMFLTSDDYISDGPNTQLSAEYRAQFTTPKGILLADDSDVRLEFCGHTIFNAAQFVRIQQDGNVQLGTFSVLNGAFQSVSIDGRC